MNLTIRDYIALILGMVFWYGVFQIFLPMLIRPNWILHEPIYPKVAWLVSNVQILFFTMFLFRIKGQVIETKVVVPAALLLLSLGNLLPFLHNGHFGVSFFLNWSAAAVWVWSVMFLLGYALLKKHTPFALYLASWAMISAANLYEYPLFSRHDMWYLLYNEVNLLFINPRFLSFGFLLFGFYDLFPRTRARWMRIGAMIVGYVSFSVLFFFFLRGGGGYQFGVFNNWVFRLPTAIWMLLLVYVACPKKCIDS